MIRIISASYRLPESRELIKLEQAEWNPAIGQLTAGTVVRHLSALLYGTRSAGVDCGVTDSGMPTAVNAYPAYEHLAYTLKLSYGELGERIVKDKEIQEEALVSPDKEIEVEYPIKEILMVSWQGKTYNKKLQVVSPPELIISDDKKSVSCSEPVYGRLRFKYTTVCHTYTVSVPKRDDSIENKYTSVAYAIYDGKPVWLVLKPPAGSDQTEGDCAGGTSITPPDDDPLPKPYGNVKIVWDYCAREEISREVTGR